MQKCGYPPKGCRPGGVPEVAIWLVQPLESHPSCSLDGALRAHSPGEKGPPESGVPVEDLPLFSLMGPSSAFMSPEMAQSRLAPTLVPGEVEELFGDKWEIEPFSANPDRHQAAFLLTKKP